VFLAEESERRVVSWGRPPQGGLTILESETGSGKTEAALGRFVQLFQAGLVDGMVFALPTRTAATQLHARVVEAMRRAFPDEACRPGVVLAVPGYLQVDDTHGRRLPEFKVLWNDDDKERARHRGWAAETPKRYLAGTIAVGTIDQVLLSSLRVGHAHLRATALLRQLLVVDEVHASDAYMNRILEEVLRFHLGAGGHAFLMSATLGTHVRRKLESAALGPEMVAGQYSSLAAALATPYPVVHHAARGAPATMEAVTIPGLPKTIHVTLEALADAPDAVASRALDAARRGARVLVLRNTVTDAVATQLALEALVTAADTPLLFRVGEVITLHHARFARDDRVLLDHAIAARFGKDAPALGGVVAVTTQTVQQSLDLDADILFTDLAPMDVLLQRFGRVHRHPEKRDADRPPAFEEARAIVLISDTPLEASIWKSGEARGKHGVGTVYDDLVILEATRRRLAEDGRLVIPAQNRALVEVTTHPEALDAVVRSLGEIWQKHRNKVFGIERAHVGIADLNLVDRTQRFGDYSFKRTELSERIAARLGESDRRAVFAAPPLGPFGGRVRELTLPGWLAREAPPDPELIPTEVQTGDGRARFAFGPLRFVYDRLGLRRDAVPSTDPTEDNADA
jgi:CRISPR-associated endonuclease/helicase Cas3